MVYCTNNVELHRGNTRKRRDDTIRQYGNFSFLSKATNFLYISSFRSIKKVASYRRRCYRSIVNDHNNIIAMILPLPLKTGSVSADKHAINPMSVP